MIKTVWNLKAGISLPFAPEIEESVGCDTLTDRVCEQNVTGTGTKDIDVNVCALPVRDVNCDLYIQKSDTIAYQAPLIAFLRSKGISVGEYTSAFSYKDSDILLVLERREDLKCSQFVMTDDKVPLWQFLKSTFAGRI